MNRKVLAVVLTLALFAGGVGLGIHLLHKEAFAQGVDFTMQIIWDDENRDDEVDLVRLHTLDSENVVLNNVIMALDGGTWFVEFVPNTEAVNWRVKVIPGDLIEGDNPENFGEILWGGGNWGFMDGI